MNVQLKDRKHKFFAPLMMSFLMIALMVLFSILAVWIYVSDPMDLAAGFFDDYYDGNCRQSLYWEFCGICGSVIRKLKEEKKMLLLNINYVPDKKIEALGLVKGNVVQSSHLGKDLMSGLKTVVGGEIAGYTEMLNQARQIAMKRMVDEAEALGRGCSH